MGHLEVYMAAVYHSTCIVINFTKSIYTFTFTINTQPAHTTMALIYCVFHLMHFSDSIHILLIYFQSMA